MIVKLLLEHDADPNYNGHIGKSPLRCTIDIEIIKILLKYGAKVDCRDFIQITPLMNALDCKQFEWAKLYLEHGANINHCRNDGRTALHEASITGKLQTIEFLLKHGANIEAIDEYKCTPLHLAARNDGPLWVENEHKEQPDAVKILLKNGANPNLKDIDLKTGLQYAVEGRHYEICS